MSSQPHILGSMTLKALLEDPNLKNPPVIGLSSLTKVKKENGSEMQYNYGSAFLGPNLWDKSYGMDLNLEYMDLDEFLSENTVPINEEELMLGIGNKSDQGSPQAGVNTPPHPAMNSPRQYLRTPPVSPSQFVSGKVMAPPTASSPYSSPSPGHEAGSSTPPSPSSPFKVDFQVSEQDMALTTIPDYEDQRYYSNAQGWNRDDHRPKLGASFDPRKQNFSEDDLKPQPIMKKSKKIFVPEDLKDDKYWARRVKNNYAAKRSRDARRVKENQIALRAAYLEKENKCLKDEMSKLRKENVKLNSVVEKYEGSSTENIVSWPTLSS